MSRRHQAGDASVVRIEMDGTPPSNNEYLGKRTRHWTQYHAAKREWAAKVAAALEGMGPAEPFDRAVVSLHYVFPDRRRHDADNYPGKMILDPLVACGVLVDDSFRHVVRLEITGEARPGERKTVVTVKEVKEWESQG